jgi:uncharacterized protein (DUF427 family)
MSIPADHRLPGHTADTGGVRAQTGRAYRPGVPFPRHPNLTEIPCTMARATWNGVLLAEAPADAVEIVEGNVYFPPDAIKDEFFQPSTTHTVCGWKGTASYYDVVVDGEVNRDAAWYYPTTKDEAKHVERYIAFWNGVAVEQ